MSAASELTARVAAHYFRYAEAVDDGDVEAIATLLADDVRVVRGPDVFRGREQVLALYRAHRDAPFSFTHHVVTNVQATREDDETVTAKALLTVTVLDADGRARLLVGRYTDRFVDVDGVLLLVDKRVDVRCALRLDASVEPFTGVEVSDSSRPLT